jgi:hypothetical protein
VKQGLPDRKVQLVRLDRLEHPVEFKSVMPVHLKINGA